MKYLVLPVIYLLTLGIFPLFLYWYLDLYIICLFDKISDVEYMDLIGKLKAKKELIEQEKMDRRLKHQ